MPRFVLNCSNAPAEYLALSAFARGYVKAMFYTNCDMDEEDARANELGVERLALESIARIALDCEGFQQRNESLLVEAMALEPKGPGFRYAKRALDEQRLGHLFWYARQGHGVAFTDDGNAPCLTALQVASRHSGQAYCYLSDDGFIYHT